MMADIRSFGPMLLENLPWCMACIEIISGFLLILDPMQAVNFSTLAQALLAPARIDPNYKRLRLFLWEIESH